MTCFIQVFTLKRISANNKLLEEQTKRMCIKEETKRSIEQTKRSVEETNRVMLTGLFPVLDDDEKRIQKLVSFNIQCAHVS